MRVKYKSEAFQHGEGDSHSKAKLRVMSIIRKHLDRCGLYDVNKSHVYAERKLIVVIQLDHYDNKYNKRTRDQFDPYQHPYDLWVHLHVLSTKLDRDIVVEIDGSHHEKQKQQQADRRAELALQCCNELFRFFPDVEVIRIPIDFAKRGTEDELIEIIFRHKQSGIIL